ncbi:ROK family protein, partial [Candidatus Saccharibacteria bacterium]|nr:ROK family protein [Candidatus Saccharibacteria bacterium]NIV03637.1 ROK family protein [Calditrichia bacterium]NIV71929.1 ROK family protein [Calditrichia bacterium]NIV98708.1 ROK family protein [Candidatus Saccharibacteria bacterium]NIW78957.1 ROK family protein [Calditrichia bacterium]
KEHLENSFTIPVFVDNDANAMAYGEFLFGAGKDYDNVICITLGTGIGGGIIIDKKLIRGSKYAGAELGHMSICHNGK